MIRVRLRVSSQITRHIFTGPSTGMGGEARGSKPNNSELNLMDQVGGAHLAYAAVLVSTLYFKLIDGSQADTGASYSGALCSQLPEPMGGKGWNLQLPHILLRLDGLN